jgi:anti-anti-sigma factor
MRSGDTAVIRLDGELDCSTAPQLEATVDEIIAAEAPQRVLVDADRLTFIDVSGLAPLLKAGRRLGDGRLQLRNPRRQVVRVIRLLDLADELGVDV